jgi:hypothetical protein
VRTEFEWKMEHLRLERAEAHQRQEQQQEEEASRQRAENERRQTELHIRRHEEAKRRRTSRWVVAVVIAGLLGWNWYSGHENRPAPPVYPIGGYGVTSGGNGYVVVCRDGWISHSGGIQGACSSHGGEATGT